MSKIKFLSSENMDILDVISQKHMITLTLLKKFEQSNDVYRGTV